MRRMALHWKILIALGAGVVVGLALNAWGAGLRDAAAGSPGATGAIDFVVSLVKFIGDLFVRCLQFIAVPIVLLSLIAGAASLGDPRRLGRVGVKTLGLFLVSASVAVVIGLVLANVLRPGDYVDEATRTALASAKQADVAERIGQVDKVPGMWRQVLDLVPKNPFTALANGEMLQVIVFAMAIGVGLTLVPREKSEPVIRVVEGLGEAIGAILRAVMFLAPYAVFCLIVPLVAATGFGVLKALGVYCVTILAGLSIILFVQYGLLLRLLGGMGMGRFLRGIAPAQLVAFSSSSSNATLPVTLECVTDRLGVSKRIASFVCPVGATVNMDGTALYQGVATVFIAQMYDIPLSFGQQAAVLISAVLASIGTPGIPGAGVVMLVIVLEAAGIRSAEIAGGIAVILGVDRVMDMCRTVVNVAGDAMASVVVARSEGERLEVRRSEA